MDDRLIFVSSDSHAGIPKELWSDYLDPRFHDLIPRLHEDNAIYPVATALLGAKKTTDSPASGAPRDSHIGLAWPSRSCPTAR